MDAKETKEAEEATTMVLPPDMLRSLLSRLFGVLGSDAMPGSSQAMGDRAARVVA